MNATKIHEALMEVELELGGLELRRQNLLRAAEGLRALLTDAIPVNATVAQATDRSSYIIDAEGLIRSAGKPLHAKLLAERISEQRGAPVARSSVESSIIRHITKAKNPKLAKMGRSTFGLVEWKQQQAQPTLVNVA